jgi:hypothetical protein
VLNFTINACSLSSPKTADFLLTTVLDHSQVFGLVGVLEEERWQLIRIALDVVLGF